MIPPGVHLLVTVVALAQASTPPGDEAYLSELLQRVRAEQVAEEPQWRRLLHAQRGAWWRAASRADGDEFFLSPDGRNDLAAELEADLSAFFAPAESAGFADEHAQCRFPARYAWISQRLSVDPSRLPPQPCPGLLAFYRAMAPASATLVFASSYLNAPASMFGHTFLRIDRNGEDDSLLLSNLVNFAAAPWSLNPFVYTSAGLLGGFEGHFAAMPYYVKVQEYGNFESRDLWEYELELAPSELALLVLHLWELDRTHFDYFFFDENCSYYMLALLEVARPELNLTGHHPLWAIPTDTMRTVLAQPGFVRNRNFRPSQRTTLLAARAHVPSAHLRLVEALAQVENPLPEEALAALAPNERARVLDLATDYLYYSHGVAQGAAILDKPDVHQRSSALLQRRGSLGVRVDRTPIAVPSPPESAHESLRLGIAAGLTSERRHFAELQFRAALHDLHEPARGLSEGSMIEFGNARVRWSTPARVTDPTRASFSIPEVTLVSVASMTPLRPWVYLPSYRVRFGGALPDEGTCVAPRCLVPTLEGGPGVAMAGTLLGRETLYAMGSVIAQGGAAFADRYRVQMGGALGIIEGLGDWLVAFAEAAVHDTTLGAPLAARTTWTTLAGVHVQALDNVGVRATYRTVGATSEAMIAVFLYE